MKYDGYGWIKVKRYKMDESLSWEERYRQLEQHHIEETTFLIDEIRGNESKPKLDFRFSPHDDMLEANIPNGFIHIVGNCREFIVRAYDGESHDIGTHDSIYEALDAANEWWQSR